MRVFGSIRGATNTLEDDDIGLGRSVANDGKG